MIALDAKGFRIAAWIGVVLVTAALIVVAVLGRWKGALVLAGFLAASVGFLIWERRLPTLFDLIFVGAAILNAAGWIWNLFDRFYPYDELTHALTCFAVTLSLGFMVYHSVREQFRGHGVLFVLAVTSFGVTLGALWEVLEWAMNISNSLSDAMIDLLMDTAGSLLAGLLSAWTIKHEPSDQLWE